MCSLSHLQLSSQSMESWPAEYCFVHTKFSFNSSQSSSNPSPHNISPLSSIQGPGNPRDQTSYPLQCRQSEEYWPVDTNFSPVDKNLPRFIFIWISNFFWTPALNMLISRPRYYYHGARTLTCGQKDNPLHGWAQNGNLGLDQQLG